MVVEIPIFLQYFQRLPNEVESGSISNHHKHLEEATKYVMAAEAYLLLLLATIQASILVWIYLYDNCSRVLLSREEAYLKIKIDG